MGITTIGRSNAVEKIALIYSLWEKYSIPHRNKEVK